MTKINEKTHWLQSPNKNYLGHWDLPESGEMVLTIDTAKWEEVENPVLRKDDPKKFESKRVVRFKEDVKPMICNQTNAQSILNSSGVKFMEDSGGVTICVYVGKHFDRVNKEEVDCIRVKAENPYTLAELEKLFKDKGSKIDEKMKDRVAMIIMEEETSSYEKAIKLLQSL
jgi:hypothetical protein